jgi:protein gp37
MGQAKYQHDGDLRTSGPGFGLTMHADALRLPYSWGSPRVVFVNSMSDLFHEMIPEGFIQRVFQTMTECPQHQFQILTKRGERLRELAPRLPWPPNV